MSIIVKSIIIMKSIYLLNHDHRWRSKIKIFEENEKKSTVAEKVSMRHIYIAISLSVENRVEVRLRFDRPDIAMTGTKFC